jgi:hypothetical protein
MQPKGNELLAGYLSPGKTISVWGSEIRVGDTNVIDISHVGFKE